MPEHWLSERHLKEGLEDQLPNGVKVPTHPIWRAFGLAPISPANWDRFVNACTDEALRGRYELVLTMNWLRDYGDQVAEQCKTRPAGGNSTGAVKRVLREVGVRIGERSASFSNRERMSKLLTLMTLEMRTSADGRVWADALRERNYLAGGTAVHIHPPDDRKGSYSLYS